MKIIMVILLSINFCYGQTTDEWLRQQETQKKYLIKQILALKTYVGYAAQGYSIANKGLNSIKDIKNGDHNLHNNFFSSLAAVNPQIKKYSKVAAIIRMQLSIAKLLRSTIKHCKPLTPKEQVYLQQVFNNVLDDCANISEELIKIIADDEQQMKDDERIKRIDLLYVDMQGNQVFAHSFCNSAKKLCAQRTNEVHDIQIRKQLNGLQ